MVDDPPQPPKFTFEAELKEERRRNIELQAEKDDLQSRYKGKIEELSRLRKEVGAQSEPRQEKKDEPPTPAPAPPAKQEHARSITDAYCPTCGDPNLDFKDETECKNCGHNLGAIATLDQVNKCPGCGAGGFPKGDPRNKIAKLKKGGSGGLDIGKVLTQ